VIDHGGLRHAPHPVRAAVDFRGRDLLPARPKPVRVIPPGVATLTRMLLENVVSHGISRPLRWAYGFERPVGGKTGTTNDNKDGWFCAITPEIAAGAWCGYDRPQGLGRAAAGTAMPIWAGVMNRLLEGWPIVEFADDPGVVRVVVDARTDSLARRDCPWKLPVAFVLGTVPDTCRANHLGDWDAILLARIQSDSLDNVTDSLAINTLRVPRPPAFGRAPFARAPTTGSAPDSAPPR
jgi:membrane carboxypeptidase/penicillin-binding protein